MSHAPPPPVRPASEQPDDFDPIAITRPATILLGYYVVVSLLTGPLFPLVFLPLYFKYHTLKYRFDDTGVSMSWGILWRREVHLTYRRIQDIHLNRNLLQRWMKLAAVEIQTASGSAGPEMKIEGILEAEQLRDYLYAQMRGAKSGKDAKDRKRGASLVEGSTAAVANDSASAEALDLLREIRDALVGLASSDHSSPSENPSQPS